MTDKELMELLPEYVSDRLDQAVCRAIESRLAQSEELRTALGAARRNTRIIDKIESKLASERFLEKVHRRTDDKGLRLSHIRLPIRIAGGVAALVFIALLFNNFTGNQFFKRIFTRQEPGHETGSALQAWAPFKKKIAPEKRGGTTEITSGENQVNKLIDVTGQVRRDEAFRVSSAGAGAGPVTTAANATNDKESLRSLDGTAGQMKTTPLRSTISVRAPAASAGRPSVPIPSSAKKAVADQVEEQSQGENGGMDLDEQIAFYEPVNANKNRKTGSVGSRNNQMKQAGKTSADQTFNPLSAGGSKRGGVIAGMIRRHGGTVDSVLEHNGDYYKVKLFLPGKKLESFQKALASKAIFASFTVAPVSPGSSTLEIIIETHAPR